MSVKFNSDSLAAKLRHNIGKAQGDMQKAMTHVSSDSRITSASEDPAGLAISENLRAKVKSYQQAKRNAQESINLVQISEGSLNEISKAVNNL